MKQIVKGEFIKARQEGLTNPEMAQRFGITSKEVRQILTTLQLSSRAPKKPGYTLVDEIPTTDNHQELTTNNQQA